MKNLRYCPELNVLTGSITASLLMCQLEYWFKKTASKPFYKFLSPCEDMHYHIGDSWTEELGFTKAEFRTAFHKIGKVYKTKKAYKESNDPFEGKLYLSYYDRIRKLTYYMRNDALVNKLLANQHCEPAYSEDYLSSKIKPHKSYRLDKTSLSPSTTNTASAADRLTSASASYTTPPPISTPTTYATHLTTSTPMSYASHIPTPAPILYDIPTPASSPTTYATHMTTPAITPYPTPISTSSPTPCAQIVDLFNKCCPSLRNMTDLTVSCKLKLDTLYHKLLASGEDVLSCLEKVFTLAEQSDFLCGRSHKSSWKAAFGWIIRMDKFFAILAGDYTAFSSSCASTTPTYSPRAAVPKFLHMYTHGFNIKELEAREQAYLDAHYGPL